MSWNYRIVKYRDNSGYGLHEVYYDDDGQPWTLTEQAPGFVCDLDEGPEGVRGSLGMAYTDARERPVLDEPKEWPGKAPGS